MHQITRFFAALLVFAALIAFAILKIPTLNGMLGGHRAAVHHGVHTIPFAREAEDRFEPTQHFISYYTGRYGPPTWNTKFGLYGRYVITIQAKVEFDRTRRRIVSFESPTGYVHEVSSIKDRTIRYHSESGRKLDEEQLMRFIEADGDLELLGIDPVMDQPHAAFERLLFGA